MVKLRGIKRSYYAIENVNLLHIIFFTSFLCIDIKHPDTMMCSRNPEFTFPFHHLDSSFMMCGHSCTWRESSFAFCYSFVRGATCWNKQHIISWFHFLSITCFLGSKSGHVCWGSVHGEDYWPRGGASPGWKTFYKDCRFCLQIRSYIWWL